MKKWILILLILVCNVGFAVTPQEYFTFATDTFMITGYNIAGGLNVVIPATFTVDAVDYSVEAIGYRAFWNKGLTSVVLPESLLYIESSSLVAYGAFRYSELTSITIPDKVHHIGARAFMDCGLTEVILGESVELINNRSFANNNITNITFPPSVGRIWDYAFSNNKFTEVIIPDNVHTLQPNAFASNLLLTKITLGTGFSWFEYGVFAQSPIVDITLNRENMGYGSQNSWGVYDVSFRAFYTGLGKPIGRFVYNTDTSTWSIYSETKFTDIVFKIPFGGQNKQYNTLENKEDATGIPFASKVGTQTIYIDSEVDMGGAGMKFYMNGQTMRFLNEVQ